MSLAPQKLSLFYRQLARQLTAGLTLAQALRAPSAAPAADCHRVAALAETGQSVRTLIAAAGPWLPEHDRPFLTAAAESGRLPLVLNNLADRYAQIHATRIRVALACAYPLLVFHFGALIFPFLRLIDFEHGFNWSLPAYLGGLLVLLLPVWGGGAVFYLLLRKRHPLALGLLDRLPAISGYRENQALADFAFALGNLLEAGAPIGSSWLNAGRIARSTRLENAAAHIHAAIENGLAPGPRLAATAAFPAEFVARYMTGETTGSLDASLLALAADYQSRANQRLVVASMLYPGILFGAVALLVVYFVISFYAGYFGTLNRLADGM
ncbi:MAG: type II secretion system F family protein [Verrucomicrobia bacterium]|nr:type II secretion system F family protein [Verrucomicrobiota bacterium]